MKTIFKTISVATFFALLISCGGNQTAQEDTTAEETTATEVVAETSSIAAGTYTIDTNQEDALKWTGTHIGKSSEHYGNIMLSKGSFTVADDNITDGMVEIDMTSITVTDIPADDESNADLVGHLSNDDFFSVETYPTATFDIKNVTAGGEGDATHTITGDLTIKDKTNEVSFPATVTAEGNSIMVNGTMTFDRTKFDIMYNSASLAGIVKDKIIGDEVKLEFKLKGTM